MSYTEIQKRKSTVDNSNFSQDEKQSLYQRINDRGFWQFFNHLKLKIS